MPENRVVFQLTVVMSPQSLSELQIIIRDTYGIKFERLIREFPAIAYNVIVLLIKNHYVVRFTDQKGISVDSAGDGQEAVDNQISKHGRLNGVENVIQVTILLRPQHRKRETYRDEPWITFQVTPTDND
jgi:hypothetical protein